MTEAEWRSKALPWANGGGRLPATSDEGLLGTPVERARIRETVAVWTWAADDPDQIAGAADAPVATGLLDRARRFRDPARTAAALGRAAFLTAALSQRLGSDAALLRLDTTCRWCGDTVHGKPVIASPEVGDLSFSFSHTTGLAVLAVGQGEVGVDVETIRSDLGEDLRIAFTHAEQVWLRSHHGEEAAALGLWTAKEAYLKGIGTGLVRSPVEVAFAESDGPWRPVLDAGTDAGWHVVTLDVGARWAGALAVEGSPRPVEVRRWSFVTSGD